MIIHTKTIPVATTIIMIATIMSPAHAYLRSTSSLQPGDYCNTSCQIQGCAVMLKTDFNISLTLSSADIPNCTDENTKDSATTCWLSKDQGNYMICDIGGETACSAFNAMIFQSYQPVNYTQWQTYNTSRHSVSRNKISTTDASYYSCTSTTTPEYGCAANYYAASGINTSNISCTPCPSGGKSAIGNVNITGCYLPSGTTGTDTTGNYKYTDNCYYKK